MTETALRQIFRRKGWDVTSFATMKAGLSSLSPAPDFLILDIMLPDGSGEDILRMIRAKNLPTKVAVCTGVSDTAKLQRIRDLRPEALLTKPVELAEILRICDEPNPPDQGLKPL